MDTTEHTALGDALRFFDWESIKNNPYLSIDANGTLHLIMQGINNDGLPTPLNLSLTAGNIIGMSGDYFGGKEVDLNLPMLSEYAKNPHRYDSTGTCETLGDYLIFEPIKKDEEDKFMRSYKRLANSQTMQKEIATIYTINDANYIPFSSTLNFYAQQLMFALRVNNYGEILNRNLSHFTPWSARAYTLGHHIALKFARMHYEINQLIKNPQYESKNQVFNALKPTFKSYNLQNLAHRYQALSLAMELFGFHYYTDHFAAGHQSLVGDLRALLPERFGYLGGILVNNIHDELNAVTVYTKTPYQQKPDNLGPPIEAGGDGDFESAKNYRNKKACLEGMHHSLQDLDKVFQGADIPQQEAYGGLNNMPDIDEKYRQPQPLIILGKDDKIYHRTNLNQIDILSPSELQACFKKPLQHGYTELSSTWEAFVLVAKLRVFSFIYQGTLQPLTEDRLLQIEQEESQLNPGRKPIPALIQPAIPEPIVLPWQKPATTKEFVQAMAQQHGIWSVTKNNGRKDALVSELQPSFTQATN